MGQPNPKRELLKQLSAPFRAAVKLGSLDTVNEGLKQMYAEQGHTELKTFMQWKKEGKSVKKGEHALLLWARPRTIAKPKDMPVRDDNEDDEMNYFPICYVFSQNQIQ